MTHAESARTDSKSSRVPLHRLFEWSDLSEESPRSFASGLRTLAFAGPTNAFCMTVYNESRDAFEASMSSLLVCTRHFHRQRDRRRCFSVLCIVADGRDEINPGILKLLGNLGLVTDPVDQVDGADLHMSMHSCDSLLKRLGTTDPGDEVDKLEPLRAVVYLKQRNRGKLQSHSLFFSGLCRQLQPTYCFQIDNGTTMAADCVLKLVERLENAPEIAALAPRIMPSMPEFGDDFVVSWQYLDFALQKSIVWPFEVATGHLSVVPGQACVFRWAALDAAAGGDRCSESLSPLEAYLRGTEASAPLEHLMYLAEDRVIGNQVVLASGRCWRLEYAPEAQAVTDACSGVGELLRQRRRWRNSALACRLWLLAQWPGFLARSDRSGANKRSFSIAMASQLALIVREFLAPAQLVALLAALVAILTGPATPAGLIVHRALYIALGADLTLAGFASRRLSGQARRLLLIGGCISRASTAGLLIAGVIVALPVAASGLLLAAPMMALLAVVLTLPPRTLAVLARAPFFPVTQLAMVSLTSLYSFWNLHDVSWGTKGLRNCAVNSGVMRRLKRWRNGLFAVWILANSALSGCALSWHGLTSLYLNPVLETACAADVLTVTLALWYLVASRRRQAAAAAQMP